MENLYVPCSRASLNKPFTSVKINLNLKIFLESYHFPHVIAVLSVVHCVGLTMRKRPEEWHIVDITTKAKQRNNKLNYTHKSQYTTVSRYTLIHRIKLYFSSFRRGKNLVFVSNCV